MCVQREPLLEQHSEKPSGLLAGEAGRGIEKELRSGQG